MSNDIAGLRRPPLVPEIRDHTHVKWFEERIQTALAAFQKELKSGERIHAAVILPGGREISATWFGFHGPDLLIVHGLDEHDRACRVLTVHQNVTIMLTALPSSGTKPPKTIGFQSREVDTAADQETTS